MKPENILNKSLNFNKILKNLKQCNSFFLILAHIQPICLPHSSDLKSSDFTTKSPFIAGWGSTSFSKFLIMFFTLYMLKDLFICFNYYLS
jgi:hypothetical protein